MTCQITWNTLSPPEWEGHFTRITRPNLLQSYDYARAVCPLQNLRGRWGLITIDGAKAGLVQILESGVFKNALHAVMLDRGPVWFDGYGNATHIEAFFKRLNETFPRRFGRRRRVIPEVSDTAEMRTAMERAGFKRLDRSGYQTIWLDISGDTETVWQNMTSTWRNMVRKAEKAGLSVAWNNDIKTISSLLTNYQSDKATKGYDGPSVRLLRSMAGTFEQKALTGQVIKEGRVVAAGLFFCHGRGATYQAGWSTDEGKKFAAHNLLLWDAVRVLKERKIHYLDLGGVNDESAQGVKKFKAGMGGKSITLAGHYI